MAEGYLMKDGIMMNEQEDNNVAVYQFKWFFYDCLWLEDKIVYPDSNCNAICETDVKTGSTRIVCTADEEEERLLFYGIYKWNEYFVLPARNAKPGIHLFNQINHEWSRIMVEGDRKEWTNFQEEEVLEYNGYLYIFPVALVVLKVNIEERHIDYIYYPDMKPEDDRRGEMEFIDNTVYIPIKHGVRIYKFDLVSEKWEIIRVNTELKGIDTLCYDGRQFWMSGVGKMICVWDEEKNKSVSYHNFPQGFCKLGAIDEYAMRKEEDGWWFNRSFLYKESIYFLPNDANMLVEFDIEKKEMKELLIEGEEETKESLERTGRFSTIKYMGAKQKDNLLLMLSNKNKNLILVDLEKKKTQTTELKICTADELKKIVSGKQKMDEGVVNLSVWLKYVSHGDKYNGSLEWERSIGKKIYEAIK